MNLIEEKATLHNKLELANKQIVALKWEAKTLEAKIRQLDKVISKTADILRMDGSQEIK